MRISHEQLKAALVASALSDFESVPAEQAIEYTFSPGFEKWAAGLLRRMSGGKRYVSTAGRVLRAVLIAALVAALLAGTALAFPAVRDLVKKFFVRQTESNVHYIDFGDYSSGEPCVDYTETIDTSEDTATSIAKIELTLRAEAMYNNSSDETFLSIEYRTPKYLPAKLIVENEVTTPFAISLVARGPGGLMCDFLQAAHPGNNNVGMAIALGDEYVHSEEVVCDTLMSVFRCKTTTVFIWDDDLYLYNLLVNADMPMSEVEKIIYSIAPRDDLNNP